MSDKISLILDKVESQDERIERVESDIRSFKDLDKSVARLLVSMEYQQKLIEDLKESVDKTAEESKTIANKNLAQHEIQNTDLSAMKTDIALLKLKSSWWGAIGGLIAFLAMAAIEFLRR
jgi:hypothetical protein